MSVTAIRRSRETSEWGEELSNVNQNWGEAHVKTLTPRFRQPEFHCNKVKTFYLEVIAFVRLMMRRVSEHLSHMRHHSPSTSCWYLQERCMKMIESDGWDGGRTKEGSWVRVGGIRSLTCAWFRYFKVMCLR